MEVRPPTPDSANANLPAGVQDPFAFEAFEGMNTATLRPGVEDKEAAWLDGFMPLGPGRNLRTMYDVGPVLTTFAHDIVFFKFANIGYTAIAIVFLTDGSVYQVDATTGVQTTVLPAGTIVNPSLVSIGVANYGNQYVLIVSNQTNGYFLWNGVTAYGPTDVVPGVGTMPTGIAGTSIEIYAGRVWIAFGATIFYSAPGSLVLFSTSGGGNFSSSDSFLRTNFFSLKQSNGFLYLIADSSINYISGVQTSGSPAVTTFTNQNLDPEVGSPWPTTVEIFNRNIIFANSYGVHIGYGGAVSKVSEKLDGVYSSVPTAGFGSFIPSSAKAIVFGKKIWLLLLPIVDPITGQQVNKLFCWNGKIWWAASQSLSFQLIQTQEIYSVLTAWGAAGPSLYPLFQNPSSDFAKIAQSRLWDRPGYEFYKYASRLWGILKYYSDDSPDLTISIDNETGSATSVSAFNPLVLTWLNNASTIINWTNSLANPIVWYTVGTGFTIIPPDAVGQNGALIGLTVQTEAADMAIVSMKLGNINLAYRG